MGNTSHNGPGDTAAAGDEAASDLVHSRLACQKPHLLWTGFSSGWVGLRAVPHAEEEWVRVFSTMDYCVLGGGVIERRIGFA